MSGIGDWGWKKLGLRLIGNRPSSNLPTSQPPHKRKGRQVYPAALFGTLSRSARSPSAPHIGCGAAIVRNLFLAVALGADHFSLRQSGGLESAVLQIRDRVYGIAGDADFVMQMRAG